MTSQTKDRTRTRGPKRELFGQIALKKGFLTEEQLEQALERLLKEVGKKLDRSRVTLLKAELESVAAKSYSPRLWAREVEA
jgi:hypothetical protein